MRRNLPQAQIVSPKITATLIERQVHPSFASLCDPGHIAHWFRIFRMKH